MYRVVPKEPNEYSESYDIRGPADAGGRDHPFPMKLLDAGQAEDVCFLLNWARTCRERGHPAGGNSITMMHGLQTFHQSAEAACDLNVIDNETE